MVLDAISIQDLLDHGHEDLVLLSQLGHQGGQRLHGHRTQFRSVFDAPNQRLNDPRGEIAEIQRVADEVDRLQGGASNVDVDVGGVEEFHDRRQQQVQVVFQIAAEFLHGLQQLS